MKNSEHYDDPTASAAIQNISKEQWRINTVIKIIKLVCALGGFRLKNWLDLEDVIK